MREYLDLAARVLENGTRKSNRTGVDTISSFAESYKVDLAKGFPLLTTKKVNFKAVLYEILWYLSGEDHIRNLQKHTSIWNAWADEGGDLDTAYGRYWRRFPSAERNPETGAYEVREVDQVAAVLEQLKTNPNSRRMVITAWEPGNAMKSALPPCHYTFVMNVQGDRLNCHLTQRSADIPVGVPFNLAAYSLLTYALARESGLTPGTFAHTLVDAHIYVDQIDGIKEQLKREPRSLPTLTLPQKSVLDWTYDDFKDFKLEGYDPHPAIKFPVAV